MEEQIVELLIRRIKNIVVTDEKMTVVPLAYLITLDIPDSVQHFFDQEVEIWLREEEEKFTTNDRFDYDTPEVRMLIDQLFDRLKQNATFHITKFNQLLERAIKLEMNYLIAPHRTLTQFLFKDSQKISTMEVYDTLKYFFRYEYYKTAISEYFNLKYLREISQDQFENLINQIDEKAFEENRLDTTLKTIKTIMAFWGEARQKEETTIPVEVLALSFKDRNLTEYAEIIDQIASDTEIDELSFDEIEQMLRGELAPGDEETTVREPAEVIGFEKTEDIEESKPEVAVHDIEVKESELPVVLEDEEEEEEEYEEEVEEQEVAEDDTTYEPQVSEPETIVPGRVADDLADHVARQISSDMPLEDINNMIKGRMRRRIVKKLFKKKENEFGNFLNSLNQHSNWKEASRIIDDEFYTRGINPYSKEAISLSDIIYLRFFPKDKYVGMEEGADKF